MKKIIENLQSRSLGTRLFILWTIIAIIGISLVIWRVSVFKSKIEGMNGFQESIGDLMPNEEPGRLRGGIEAIGEIRDSIKDLRGVIGDVGALLGEAEEESVSFGEEVVNPEEENIVDGDK